MNLRRYPTVVSPRRGDGGFTLLEIMLVVVIIGMLAGVVSVNIIKHSKFAKQVAAKQQIDAYRVTLGSYELENGFFPSTEQGLQALITAPTTQPVPLKWNGPYLDPPVLRSDPWGRPYFYKCPGTHNPNGYDLYSAGENGIEGDEDDIGNWQ